MLNNKTKTITFSLNGINKTLQFKSSRIHILKKVSLKDIAIGILKCLENAEDLLKDAELFVERKKKARAVVFLVAALEEHSKIIYLMTEAFFPPRNPKLRQEITMKFREKFKNHAAKQTLGLGLMNLADDFDFEKSSAQVENSKFFIKLAREQGLYVDMKNGKFLLPEESLNKNEFFKENFDGFVKSTKRLVQEAKEMFGDNLESCLTYLHRMEAFLRPSKEDIRRAREWLRNYTS